MADYFLSLQMKYFIDQMTVELSSHFNLAGGKSWKKLFIKPFDSILFGDTWQ